MDKSGEVKVTKRRVVVSILILDDSVDVKVSDRSRNLRAFQHTSKYYREKY
jgi:hypothetical protein